MSQTEENDDARQKTVKISTSSKRLVLIDETERERKE
jgi:hypothetical protein